MGSVRTAQLAFVIALTLPGCVLAGCGQDDGAPLGSESSSRYHDASTGITVALSSGWHPVPAVNLPGANIALEVASFRARGGVHSICIPHNIVDQIPPGGALVQLLEDPKRGDRGWRKEFPPLRRPFRLGPLEGHECGEAFSVGFRQGGRGFSLRVWTTPTGPSQAVRHQIQGLVDSLEVRPPRAPSRPTEDSIDLGGRRPLEMVAARGSIWVLTCDGRCTARAGPSKGRIVRIDPDRGRVIASVKLRGASGLAVGAGGVFVTDFWRDTVRRLDPESLRVTAKLRLVLPFEVAPGDDAFLPYDIAAMRNAVWISTARGVLARADPQSLQASSMVRLPFDAGGEIAAGKRAVWVAEGLLGVYRVDTTTNRVVAKIPIASRQRRLAVDGVAVGRGRVYATGAWSIHGAPAKGNGLARIDADSNRVEGVSSLPPGGFFVTFGDGALWVAPRGHVLRIDPRTGEQVSRLARGVGAALVATDGRLWTASSNDTIRQIQVHYP